MASSIINSDDGVISGTSGLKSTGGDDGVTAFQQNGTERMRIDSSGNVGIATSTHYDASTKLTVAGRINTSNGTAIGSMNYGGGAVVNMGSLSNHPLQFITNNTTRASIDTSGNFQFNSGYGSVATAYGCRAWVNFDGTGTPAIREDGNVSSITDDGTGSYTVNFTTAMPDANYCVSLSSDTNASGGLNAFSAGAPTTSGVPVYTYGVAGGGAGAYRDTSRIYVAIFR